MFCSYVPERPGFYQIIIFYDNIEIEGSPFKIKVDVIGDKHSKVKVYGPNLYKGKINLINNIFIDFRDSGKSICIRGTCT